MTSDDNLKTFYYALAYNVGVLVVSVLLWFFVVRPVRQDTFKPNAKSSPNHEGRANKTSPYDEFGGFKSQFCMIDSPEATQPSVAGGGSKLWGSIIKEYKWVCDLWAWNIADFGSTDVYLYLLFLKRTAFFFAAISALTLGAGLPIIWTAGYSIVSPINGQVRKKGFFERSVITNVGTTDFTRLWILYALVWVILGIGLYCSLTFYRSVRSDEFRPAVLLSKRRRASFHRTRRFMANKHTVCIHGINRDILTPRPIADKLHLFIDPSEIVAIHIAIDHSEAYIARQIFEKYLARLLEAQKRHQEEKMRTKKSLFSNITESAEREAALDETLSFFNQSGLPPVVPVKTIKSSGRGDSCDVWDLTSDRPSPLSSGELTPASSTGYIKSRESCNLRYSRYVFSNHDLVDTLLQSTEPDSVLSSNHVNNADNIINYEDGPTQADNNSPCSLPVLRLPSYIEGPRSRKCVRRRDDPGIDSPIGISLQHHRSTGDNSDGSSCHQSEQELDKNNSPSHPRRYYPNMETGRNYAVESPSLSVRDSNWSSRLSSQITSQLLTRMHERSESNRSRRRHLPQLLKSSIDETQFSPSVESVKIQNHPCRTPDQPAIIHSDNIIHEIPNNNSGRYIHRSDETSAVQESPGYNIHVASPLKSVSHSSPVGNGTLSCCPTFKKNPKKLEAKVTKWERKVLSQYSILDRIRRKPPQRNVGIAFVCFQKQEAARFALTHDFTDSHCPVFDTESANLSSYICKKCGKDIANNKCVCRRWKPEWKVRPAPPPEDILWDNMHIDELSRTIRRVGINLLIFLLSLILTSSAMLADALIPFAQHVEVMIKKATFFKLSFSGWLAPMLLYVINALLLPLLVSWAADVTRFWRTSARERAVLHGNVNFMVLNSLVFPILGTTSIRTLLIFLYETSVSDLITVIGQLVAGASGSFMIRYVLNTAFVNSAMQLLQLPMFTHQRIMVKFGKKPPKWTFDFGYWYAFHLSVLAVCVTFCVDVPLVPPLGALFFTAKYWVDKYNMCFDVWRIQGESAGAVASSAVSFMLYFQALFLFSMAGYFVTIGIHAESVLAHMREQTTSPRSVISNTVDNIFEPRLAFHDLTQIRQSRKRLLWLVVPHESRAKALVIGGFTLLAASLLLIILTFGQKAQRTIVDHHAGTLRRIAQVIYVRCGRLCTLLGFSSVQKSASSSSSSGSSSSSSSSGFGGQVMSGRHGHFNELSPSEREDLAVLYCHPYNRFQFETIF